MNNFFLWVCKGNQFFLGAERSIQDVQINRGADGSKCSTSLQLGNQQVVKIWSPENSEC